MTLYDKIMALYVNHGTHEKFHFEFKTDLDLERLSSGKFDTTYLFRQLAALAMDILRLMGQRGLLGPDAPVLMRPSAGGVAGSHLPGRASHRARTPADPGVGCH